MAPDPFFFFFVFCDANVYLPNFRSQGVRFHNEGGSSVCHPFSDILRAWGMVNKLAFSVGMAVYGPVVVEITTF
jgi:hypothetical protein